MATPDIPDHEPTEITIGETEIWTKRFADYIPADGWALTYYFRGGNPGLDVVAIQDPDDANRWKATITAAQSATLIASRYDWQVWVSKGAGASLERHQLDSGYVTAVTGFVSVGAATTYDGRSEVKKTLDAIRAAIGKRATAAQLEREVGNTRIQFMAIGELIIAETRFQQLYNQEVRAKRMRKGAPFLLNIHTRFNRPT